ncbi:MAG: AsmA-like C-terminal region-containing protein [Pseudomonadota bacterium]
MDLSTIYRKTPKGLRARALLIGGLSSHLIKVLTHVDGSSTTETILLNFDKLTQKQLTADLTQLEQEGYIRLSPVNSTADWEVTVNFEPMVVEEFQSEEELELSAQAKAAEQALQKELAQAKQEEEHRLAAQLKADKIAHKLRGKERIKAETKVIAKIEKDRLALEAARREAEAQLKARQEVERIEQQQIAEGAAKLAEETRLKAELKARELAEHADAEAAAKENARREIERISQETEEAQKKADIEAKAKQESERLEALNMAKAAEDTRQAELKAQAEYQAQLEQSEKAAAEQARIELEAAAQAAEIERLKQAEKAAQAEALKEKLAQEERERLEMAIVLRKAEEDRKNAEVQAKAEKLEAKRQLKDKRDTHAKAKRKAKDELKEFAKQQKLKAQAEKKAKAQATDQARLETARIAKETKIASKIALENERLQAKQAADGFANSAATITSVYDKAQYFVSAKKIKQWLRSFTKVIFIYVPVLLLLVLLLLQFINLSFLINPIEQMASESIGETVGIKKVYVLLWPQPHFELEDVTIGTSNNIKAVHVLPVIASLFEEVKVVKSLVIEGLKIEQTNFSQPLQWSRNASKVKRFKVEQINLKKLTLVIRDLQLGSFDGKVMMSDTGALSSIELVSSNNALSVKISPQGNDSEIELKAANWALPLNQKIVFGVLNAKGLASQYKLNLSQIEAEIFGGNLIGQANIEWPDGKGQWLSAGKFKLSNANTEALLNNFGSAVLIDGKLALDASFSAKSSEVSKLASNAITDANFDVRQGSIQRIELMRSVLSPIGQSLIGDNTKFDKLTGSIKLNQNQTQFSKLVLASSQFNASGFVNINANQIITGRVYADLVVQSRHLKANFGITGRAEDIKSN